MAAIVNNITQIDPADGSTWTAAAVGDADTAVPFTTSGSTNPGIDGVTLPQQFANEATALVTGDHYSLWSGDFPASASYDMSTLGQQITIHFANLSPGYTVLDTTSSDAYKIYLFSGGGTTNYAVYDFQGTTDLINGKYYPFTVHANQEDSTGGTFDNTDVTGIGFAAKAGGTGVFGFQVAIDQAIHVDGAVFEDTGVAATVTMEDYYNLLEPEGGETYHSLLVKRAGTTFEFGFPFTVSADDYDDSAIAVGVAYKQSTDGFPTPPAGYYAATLDGQASGTQLYQNATFATLSGDFDFTVDGDAASTDITINNLLVAGIDGVVIGGAGTTITGGTISSPATVDISDGDLELTISDSTAAIDWTADLVAGSTITTDSDMDITFAETDLSDININFTASNTVTVSPTTGSGTYTLTGMTSTGTVEFDNSTANDTTVSVASALTTSVASPTAGGGAVTVTQPQDTFTLTSNESSSLIQIFTTGTQTLLDSTTGTSLAYVFSGTVTVDYVVQKAGFILQRVTGVVLTDTTVAVTLVSDPVYDSGHGLTYTTDASWSRTNNELTVPTFGPSVRGVHSLLVDSFISETALRNTAYNIQMNGPNAMFLVQDAEGDADSSIENMTAGGVRYVTTAGVTAAEWVGVESIGTATGFTGEYQQVDGSGTTDARATGSFDEVIKVYGDVTHGNFDYRDHLVLKFQPNGYRESRVDILSTYGISALEPTHYIVAMSPVAIAAATGDPAISITITDHGASPVTWNSLPYSITIVDNGVNSGEDILRELNYNLSLDATYNGVDPFNWPEMVKELGDSYETLRGITEGGTGAALKGVRVLRGGLEHPDFTRFESDNGSYYTPPVTAQAATSGLFSGSRIQVYNVTAAASGAWAATTAYSVGDRVLRSTGAGLEEVTGLFMLCTTAGTSGGTEPTWDTTVGNTTADGTVVWTTFAISVENDTQSVDWTLSYTDGEEFTSGDNVRVRATYASGVNYKEPYETTTIASTSGWTALISQVDWDAVEDLGIDGSTITEFTTDFTNLQVDIDDGDGETTKARLIAWQANELADSQNAIAYFYGAIDVEDSANFKIISDITTLRIENVGTNTVIFTDTDKRLYTDDGSNVIASTSNSIHMESGKVYLAETGTSGLTPSESSQLSSINSNTSGLTYTVSNKVDANIHYVNDIEVDGAGSTGDPWGPV